MTQCLARRAEFQKTCCRIIEYSELLIAEGIAGPRWCASRLDQELGEPQSLAGQLQRRKGALTAVHLKIVLGVIDGPAIFPLKDE